MARVFVLIAGDTGSNVTPDILVQLGPPAPLSEQGAGPLGSRMAGKMRRMTPLRSQVSWKVWLIVQAHSGSRLRRYGSPNLLLHIPSEGGYHADQREDSLWLLCLVLVHRKLLGESVRFNISRPRAIREREVKSGEE